MSDLHANKRARVDSTGDAHPHRTQESDSDSDSDERIQASASAQILAGEKGRMIREHVDEVDEETLARIVVHAATVHPDIYALLGREVMKLRHEIANRIIDFPWQSGHVWRQMNSGEDGYSSWRDSKRAEEIVEDIQGIVSDIVDECGPYVHPQTRYNGLAVLRKMAKSIALASNSVAREIQDTFSWDPFLEEAMLSIVSAMPISERQVVCEHGGEKGLWPKLEELKNIANNHDVFERLWEVTDLLEEWRPSESEE
ncbi:hypothetical protein BO70DRAFT_359664 [Aspergillus heteromorphus CBS 117.55]|uniref:Uncharacterized protein n=1 Tax=Aspergillus heteromorphus CBS 117.55 TaxID=1448321 RepID=A0A317WS92_9EURO|nr:uncharacterized protein BO70DRAFT_359664 [Aspergillus heteromorphus CBS 117.55]PWY88192.1 hypothetical protein BO70DRAFT_359664 [Aspergillus heteromorphus CBS 117.55]